MTLLSSRVIIINNYLTLIKWKSLGLITEDLLTLLVNMSLWLGTIIPILQTRKTKTQREVNYLK